MFNWPCYVTVPICSLSTNGVFACMHYLLLKWNYGTYCRIMPLKWGGKKWQFRWHNFSDNEIVYRYLFHYQLLCLMQYTPGLNDSLLEKKIPITQLLGWASHNHCRYLQGESQRSRAKGFVKADRCLPCIFIKGKLGSLLELLPFPFLIPAVSRLKSGTRSPKKGGILLWDSKCAMLHVLKKKKKNQHPQHCWAIFEKFTSSGSYRIGTDIGTMAKCRLLV